MEEKFDKRKMIKVRGFDFARSRVDGDIPLMELCKAYLVLRALDGDKLAQELLDITGTRVHDLDGNLIYPPAEKK